MSAKLRFVRIATTGAGYFEGRYRSSSYPSTTLRVVPLPIGDDGEELVS